MNLFDLTFMAIGGIIGAGIFSSVGSGIAVTRPEASRWR